MIDIQNIQGYINKVNIKINVMDFFSVDILTIILGFLIILLFIKTIVVLARYSKQKKYNGTCDATFVSSSMYEKGKKAKKAVVRYVINDRPIVKRMKIPKKYRNGEKLVVKYDKNNITKSILEGDKYNLYKAYRLAIFLLIFIGATVYYTMYM